MPCPVKAILTLPTSARLLAAASFGALLFAFTLQYGFGVHPCVLCLWQRAPYAVVGVLSLLAWIAGPKRRIASVLLALCALACLIGMGLAVFHTGVERHWWLGTSGCAIQPLQGHSPDDLREALLHTVTARCDEIAWTVLGLSMANLNIALSLALAFFAAAAAAKTRQDL